MLVLDVGSSSARAGIYGGAGTLRPGPVPRVPCAWRTGADGAMEADGDALAEGVLQVIDAAMDTVRQGGIEISAVACATFWHGVMGVDGDGRPVTPLFGWGDARARAAADALRRRTDAAAFHRRTGCFAHESYPAAKLLWLREARGDTFPRAAAWLSIGEHLQARLFGVRRTSPSMASGTGLLDVGRMTWDAEALDAVGLSAHRLPELSDAPLVGLKPELARRWPELASVPWYPALGDGACASLGSGAVGPTRPALTVGTSAAVRVLREDPDAAVPDALWCYRLDARRTVSGRALSNAGVVWAWLRRTLALPPAEGMDAALLAAEPRGLSVVPSLLAERPPLEDAAGSASMTGMTPDTTPVEIARAWLDAVAARLADAVGAVEAEFGPATEVVASGGALRSSAAFRTIIQRAIGRPLRLSPDREETMRGAALIALERLGAIDDALAFAAVEPGDEIPGG